MRVSPAELGEGVPRGIGAEALGLRVSPAERPAKRPRNAEPRGTLERL